MSFINKDDVVLIFLYLIPKFIFQLVLNLGREDKWYLLIPYNSNTVWTTEIMEILFTGFIGALIPKIF